MKRFFPALIAIVVVTGGLIVYLGLSRKHEPVSVGVGEPPPPVPTPDQAAPTPPPPKAEPPSRPQPGPPSRPEPPPPVLTPGNAAPTPPPPPVAEPAPAGRPPNRVTSRALLAQGEDEEPGYGLYSYLVFGLRPTRQDVRYARYVKALEAYLELEEASSVRRYVQQDAINVTYLPVKDAGVNPTAAYLLESYDYARAQRLLALTSGEAPDGPFLISARRPLSKASTLPSEYLFQDLSTVPPELVRLWVHHFIEQAAQERFWERKTRDEFVLEMRTYIARGGNEVAGLSAAFATLLWHFK